MRKLLPVIVLLLMLCLAPLCAHAGTSEISGIAWYDSSGTGVLQEKARPQAGVAVSLYRVDENGKETWLLQHNTAADGTYAFTGLDAGTYVLRAKAPSDHLFIEPKAGGSVILPALGDDSTSLPIVLGEGQAVRDAHIGVSRRSCYIKAYVFEDANQNGGRSTAEPVLRYVPLTLWFDYNGQSVPIATEKTDKDGCATFWQLTPGTYRLSVALPDPYIIGPLGEKINGWYNCFPPCDSGEGEAGPFTIERGESLGVGVGAVSTGSVRGTVWLDADMDGLRGSESGYAGATVRLESEEAGVSRHLVTDETGEYRFERLLPGEYTLTVTLPESAMFTLPGGDSLMTAGYDFSDSAVVTVQNEQETAVRPVGVMPVTTLTVHVYNDLNANGAHEAEEPPFAGALLEVMVGEETVASVLSDGEGTAFVPVVRGGDMDVHLVLPAGQVLTVEGADNDFTAPAATGDLTQPLTLPHGQDTLLQAGVTLPASISGMLFDDGNISGILEEGEQGLGGFTVQAVNARGEVVAQTQTDGTGVYTLQNLLPQAHFVRFCLVDAYVFTGYSETGAPVENDVIAQTAAYGETDAVLLSPGQNVTGVDGGIFRSATVSGSVLLETGIESLPVEGGMPDIYVALLDEYGAEVSDTTTVYTDENGSFYLKGALPGTYMLEYVLPEGACFTRPKSGTESFVTEPFTLDAADDRTAETLYAIYTGTLSGTLYHDVNLDAVYGADEPVLSDVTIALLNRDLDFEYETRTLDDGRYTFEGLRPGAYTVSVTLPAGYGFAYDASSLLAPQAGGAGSASFDMPIGGRMEERNIAAAQPASLKGTVFFDNQNNNVLDAGDPGAGGITLAFKSVNGPQSYTVQSDENGVFLLDALVPGSYTLRVTLAGDCIPADGNPAELIEGFWTSEVAFADGEAAAPAYAILRYARVAGHVWSMDGSLTGVAGRSVTLYQNGVVRQTVVTDPEGAFEFLQLKPGAYSLDCDLPEGNYRFARRADTEDRDSFILADEGSMAFIVPLGADMADCDIGIGAMGMLGDTAWLDVNGNGLQDAEEPGVPGIVVELYQYGELAATAETDIYGHYLLRDLYPGTYTVRVQMPAELKTTVQRTDVPLAASVLPQEEAAAVETQGVIVPSGGRNLSCDFGFVLRVAGKYPASMQEEPPTTDWSFDGRRK